MLRGHGVRRVWTLALLVCALLVVTSSRASASEILAHERYSLDNGLDVVLHEDHRLPLVALNLSYHVGSAHDGSRRGLAHVVEHLMFRGTSDLRDGELVTRLQEAGATGMNATTRPEYTSYYYVLPSDRLALGLWMESNRMAYMLPAFTDHKFNGEVLTTINEWEEKVKGERYGTSFNALRNALFPVGHPYRSVMPSEIAMLQTHYVGDFVRRYHGPANATLVLAGDLPPDIRALVEHYFAHRDGGERPSRPSVKVPVRTEEQRIVRRAELAATSLVLMGWNTPGLYQPGDAEADVLATTLNSDRLAAMAEARAPGMFLDIQVRQLSRVEGSTFMLMALGGSSAKPMAMRSVLDAILDELRAQPLSVADVRRARRRLTTRMLRGLQGLQGRASRMQFYIAAGKPPDWLDEDIARYEGVNEQAVAAFVRDHLTVSRRVLVLAYSEDSE